VRLFCHRCRKLCFRDTCKKCRAVIDAQYAEQLQMMRGLVEFHPKDYLLIIERADRRNTWRN
jgi:hypothetical protein